MMKNEIVPTITKIVPHLMFKEHCISNNRQLHILPKQLTHMFVQSTSQICHLQGLPP
ncbi:hypothetical protein DPMN_042402 [Dreissena polymorpha]|uniref:Uncharacterized protein n=1 Tax=Dreissena polymorpha TaxID=45954 RepID=A0A9D4D102_DREPO|nr:hypothetical protein DPMN_042402 [Dreissena polymorpha]